MGICSDQNSSRGTGRSARRRRTRMRRPSLLVVLAVDHRNARFSRPNRTTTPSGARARVQTGAVSHLRSLLLVAAPRSQDASRGEEGPSSSSTPTRTSRRRTTRTSRSFPGGTEMTICIGSLAKRRYSSSITCGGVSARARSRPRTPSSKNWPRR